MSSSNPVIIGGKPVGKLKSSWLLFKESWRYLAADKEMLMIPLITAVLNLLLFGFLIGAAVLIFAGGEFALSGEGEPMSNFELLLTFFVYVISAFTLALSQSAVAHTVYTRAHGGDSKLGEALGSAFSNWSALLIWSLITATVGIVLRMVAERSKLLGSIMVRLMGAAWSIATYFVIPSIVLEKKGSFSAISRSKEVFLATWGETLVANISIGLTFFIAHIIAFVTFIGLMMISPNSGMLLGAIMVLYVGWLVISILVQSVLESILKTLLFVYATERVHPPNFNPELLDNMFNKSAIPAPEEAPVPADDSVQ